MKAISFFPFLLIFLTACFDQEPVDLAGDGFNTLNGTAVASEPYCQRLQVVDPPEVRKHELPLAMQPLRDFCQGLFFTRDIDFSNTEPVFLCRLNWDQTDQAGFQQFLTDWAGEDLSATLQQEGDILAMGSEQSLLVSESSAGDPQLFWTMSQLWAQWTPQVPDLESLSWRLSFQHSNSVVCSARAKWEVRPTEMFLHNLEKCYGDGQAFKETYRFSSAGRLLELQQTPLEASPQCGG